ncbi:MAG TPA: electron transfer flavoprotein subunit beta/FixA family protein [Ornithinimicrobium sp.]|uniref:electron transfer flavoprotein subunit beta/FixA family protein n=1 Tax=Ornithinimicrobium sp. TaxID=1977084 RepID=UPI002B462AE3|nr:electron transfer flavoprotein subunit beta/FixA family protein [Ornithinimicrobium sp.]HKJ11889.1 electron transfer flavoprotein subunit beta/FixA family protein [Ornithinimicrobium sp.]
MSDVLVCIKRVPDTGGEVSLDEDGMNIDIAHLGATVSPHEEAAIELAVQQAGATDGEVTVLSLGDDNAVEQLRDAVALGCTNAVLVEATPARFGPRDIALAIADVVRSHEEQGRSYDLILLGNDAADTGDFQVGVRLGYALERPVVTGISTVELRDGHVVATGDSPTGGNQVYEIALPAVVTVMEGGVEPRYPSIPGRMKAKRAKIETVEPEREPDGSGRVRLVLPPAPSSQVRVLGEGPEAAPAVADLLQELGVLR